MDDFVQFLTGGASKSPAPTNVGNIRPVGSTTGFQQFDTPEAGIKAVDDQLRIYGSKHKVKTLREVISRWAPPSENDTEAYIKNVSQRTGLKPDEEIDLSNPTIRHIISGPIILQEQGLQKLKGAPQSTTALTEPTTQEQPTDEFVNFLTKTPEPTVQAEALKSKTIAKPTQTAIDKYVREPILAAVEPPLQAASSLGATAIGNVIGAAKHYGERGTAAEEEAAKFAEKYTYEPRGKIAQKVLPKAVELSEKYGINKVTEALPGLVPELATVSELSTPVKTQIGSKIGGLTEQFAKRKTAEAGVETPKEFKSQISEDVLHDIRLKKASELPVPIELTVGQASQDPVLISRERNERGFKEAHAQRFNEQNRALQENANIIKQNAAPNVLTDNYVADAQNLIDSVKSIKEANKIKTQEAYKALENAAGGKFPLDAKKFGQNALEQLSKKEDIEFLPETFKSRIEDYANGKKEMNFDQFENLRSQLFKATKGNPDGNVVHALNLVRNELENLPMTEVDANIKALADNARKTAKADFDLEKSNPLYSKVLSESADSKDFIQNFVINSKNADFMKSIDLLKNDPTALEHLRSGTMDYIIRQSTDASGNFSTAKFQKSIENLNVNKKLDVLFGEHSKQLQDLAEVSKIVEARPRGSFVNESNTATAIGSAIKEYGADVIKDIPIVRNIVKPASRILQERKIAKEVKQSLNPKPRTKLSDIGK